MKNRKFVKRPIVIEAFQFRHDYIPDWFMDKVSSNEIICFPDHCMIRTLEGTMRGENGDFIIKGIEGEIYPCKEAIFNATYEEITE